MIGEIKPRQQSRNGRAKGEIGTSGLEAYYGQVQKAHHADLYWPEVYDSLYRRLWRSDPQVAQYRQVVNTFGADVQFYWELPWEDPTPAELTDLEFLNSIWDDIEGGQRQFIDSLHQVTGFGWGWWETKYITRPDGYVSFEKLAWRDYSSFVGWKINDATGEVEAFIQEDYPFKRVPLPIDKAIHLTYGDPNSPEGLGLLEALWRTENFMYNLEVIYGIGSEKTAGYMLFQSDQKLDSDDIAAIEKAAQSALSAQEGSYLVLPAHITASIIDGTFAAANSVLSGIKFYSIVKQQILGIQWIALSATAESGSNAAMTSSAGMFLSGFNANMSGLAAQTGLQMWEQLKRWNPQFQSWKKAPVLRATPIEQSIDLLELAQFISGIAPLMELTPEDIAAIRRKSNFLPEIEITEVQQEDEADDSASGATDGGVGDESESEGINTPDDDESGTDREFAHPVAIGRNQPTESDADDLIDLDDEEDIKRMIRKIAKIDPVIADLLRDGESDSI